MKVAMLGSDYSYAVMPAYAGGQSYVRSQSYLGETATSPAKTEPTPGSPEWMKKGLELLTKGADVATAWLERDTLIRTNRAEIERNQIALEQLRSGANPFSVGPSLAEITPLLIGGGIAIAMVLYSRKRKR